MLEEPIKNITLPDGLEETIDKVVPSMKKCEVENKVNQLSIVLQQLLKICDRGKKSNDNECEDIYQRIKRIIDEKDRIYTDLVKSVNDEKNEALKEQEENLNSQYLMQLTKQKHDIEKKFDEKYSSLESKYNSLIQENKKLKQEKEELQTNYNRLKEALKKKDKELKKQREDLEKDKNDALESLTNQKDEALEQQETNLRLQYNTLLENQKQQYQTNYDNKTRSYNDRISSYKRIVEMEKSNLINSQIKLSYILMYLYQKEYKSIISDIQPFINEISIPSIILTNIQSSNRVGIDLKILRYRDYDNEKSIHKNVGDVIVSYEKEKQSKSIAMTLLRKEYDVSIYALVKLQMKTVFIHDLYAFYLKIFYEKEEKNEEMDERTYVAGLYENNMEILEVTYNKDRKTINCSIEYENKFSINELIKPFKPAKGKKYELEELISSNQKTFNSGLIEMEVALEVYFGNMTENKVYLHLPNYTRPLFDKKEIKAKNVILDCSNDSSEGALKFADSFYAKINLL